MRLVFPTIAHKEKAIDFIQEFIRHGSEVNGSGGLDGYLAEATYEEWLSKVMGDIDIANLQPPRVPALTYFCVREEDDSIVGMVNIRLALNDFLREEGGHIGYCVRPAERGRHYATRILGEALRVCARVGISRVIITCDKSNIPSARVIQNWGGRLDAEFYSETFGETIQRYIVEQPCQ